MKRAWPVSQILLLYSIAIAIAAVVFMIVVTNTTLRSVEKNLPDTLFNELISLDLVLDHISDVVIAAERAATKPTAESVEALKKSVLNASARIGTMRQTYVFDNLVQASAFHAVVAPAVSDLKIWLSEGISGYGPSSPTTIQIALSRISSAFQKAKALNNESRQLAQTQLDEQRQRLDRFLFSVNLLLMLTLIITVFAIILFIRQHLARNREIEAQQALQKQSDLLHSLFENISLGITLWSSEGLLLYANTAYTRLTGYTIAEIKNRQDWLQNAYPDHDYRQRVAAEWEASARISENVHEFVVTCKNGQVKEIEFRGSFLPDGRSLITLADITSRKRDKERLRYFKTAVEYSSDAIGISDPSGIQWFQNTSFQELFGEIEQSTPAHLYVDEYVWQEVFDTVMGDEPWHGEVEMHGANGENLNVLLRAYAIKNKQNQIIGIVSAHTDITGQKQAEKALLASEKKYRAVVENTPDLLYRTDLNGVITFISSSVYRLSGYTVEEAIGLKMAEEVYAVPEERQAFLDTLRKDGIIENFQAQLKRKDGSSWWAATNAHFFRDEDGNIRGVEGITRDITTIKQTEAALVESEQRMRAILEASPDPMVMYDRDGQPQFINRTFTELFGWSLEEFQESHLAFVPESQKTLLSQKTEEICLRKKPVKFETQRLTKDGRVLDIILSAAATSGYEEEPTGLVVHLTDITERKALEAQYEQAQKMESLGTLAGGIAHDFNNLLGGIFGYLDIARKKTKDPKTIEYLNKAFNVSERAAALTHQLLTFSKGGAPVKNVESLVPFLQETVQFALSGSSASCRYTIAEDLWMCDYDRNQLAQVIDNIVINAQQAMSSEGSIHVVAVNQLLEKNQHAGLKAGNYVKISISDTGVGIPSKHIARIFDPFFTTKQKGSGLGLATAYSIVKKHDGIITVESEQGVGTTFHLLIPAAEKQANETKTVAEELYQGSGTILIMDDDELLVKMITDMLEDMGFESVSASDGEQALDLFKQSMDKGGDPFQAIILDLTIRGGKGGKETVREIRKLDSKVPVFVASGYSDDDAIANPETYGFTGSLKKPFGIELLSRILEKHL